MKVSNNCLWTTIALLLGIILACGKKECIAPITLSSLLPNNNPVNGPVLITGRGFRESMVLRFGELQTSFDWHADSVITARVPSGLLGVVEVSLAEENCITRENFEVISTFPNNLPASPPNIIIPTQGLSFPLDFSLDGSKRLINVYDPNHRILAAHG